MTPAPAGSTLGNRGTALRYARLWRALGHRVRIVQRWTGGDHDLLVALHARRSHPSVRAFARAHPRRPIVVVLTGTDVYGDLPRDRRARASLDLAAHVVVLQPEALRELEPAWRRKASAILQSAEVRRARAARSPDFDVVALAHLRAVKDPFLAAEAARGLPETSRVRILHAGRALDAAHARQARRESAANPRWKWLGPRSHRAALALLARAHALVQTSRAEGGSSAIAEAVVAGLPILCTRIPGAVGMLGRAHPGYCAVGDARGLARLLARAERDPAFRRRLIGRSRALAPRFAPARERAAWRRVFARCRATAARRP